MFPGVRLRKQWTALAAFVLLIPTLLFSGIPTVGFAACQPETAAWRHMQLGVVEVLNSKRQHIRLTVRIADDRAERAAGFQYICPQLFHDNAILFVFSSSLQAQFHMRNVYAPLDIAFFDKSGKIVKIMSMRPAAWEKNGQSRFYGPAARFRYALEARVGYFAENGIEVGNSMLLIN